jgi:drug/metabolite transporter (DMT)-like permease
VIFVNLATLCWATNAVLGRWLRDDIGPLALTTLRFTVATAFFGILLRGRPAQERRYGKDKWWIVGMGLAGVVGFSPLLYLGLRYSTAVNCSLIQGFSPLITALIAGLIIQEPVTRRQLAGAILGLIGVTGLLSNGSLTFLIAAGAAFELQHIPLNLRMETIAAIAHICVVPTIIGYWCWNRGVMTLGAGGAMVFYNTLPLYGAFLGAALLGEPLGIIHFVFGGLIIAGGLWATLARASRKG